MSNHGYQRLPKQAMLSLKEDLEQNAWGEVDVTPYAEATDHLNVPILPLLKLRLIRKIDALAQAIGSSRGALDHLDSRWDATQRKLEARLTIASQDDDAALKDAAKRLRESLLLGDGLAQTQLAYLDEISFGVKQVGLARAPKSPNSSFPVPSEDVERLGLGALIDEIETRTQEFEEALKKHPEEGTSRGDLIRSVFADCVTSLNAAHDELSAQLETAKDPEVYFQLQQLKAAFISLLNRYPAGAAHEDEDAS